jgi:hypothetical protein
VELRQVTTVAEWAWLIVMALVALATIRWGGKPERQVAAASAVAWVATRLVFNTANYIDPQWGVLAVDVLFLLALTGVALTADRFWPMFAAAFQLIGVLVHLAITLDDGIRALAYIRGLVIWSYLVVLALAIGTYFEWRRRRRAPGALA